ncbi:3-oxoadipate enol-lactonase [Pseudonocardia thermophila]|jgi:Predicted hydrolases or acyltransferases (alpha/beta hydrolase superfamily)|uniref:3-oxoadipate enol-lactonase n=1 Tax=Pseudonocardia thermophila TaxID=1848 RepID=A0A1M6T4E9_PSETH|nr:alpha/beta fold hydrolase [Pseudonocardia thermophila]SHK51769.1 3-oxoadipate enol-lactonase [Pseudonocardia thermophila]
MSYTTVEVVQTRNGPVAYHELGSGEVLLMHHGGESNRRQYAGFAPLLGEGIRSISYDQRDVGESFRCAEPYSIGDLADDCVHLMDALGIERAHVMGFSFGGCVALHVAVRHPDRVQSLIVGTAPASHRSTTDFAQDLLSRQPEERFDLMVQAILSPAGQADPAQLERLRTMMAGQVSGPETNRMKALRTHDLGDELRGIKAPTLLVYGTDDPLAPPEVGRHLADLIPDSALVCVEGARHGLTSEFKEPVARMVREHVLANRAGS